MLNLFMLLFYQSLFTFTIHNKNRNKMQTC